jgi:hypothetical protein
VSLIITGQRIYMDLASKILLFAAVLVLIIISGYQSDRLEDLRYENEKLKRATRGQFKKKSDA